MEWIIVISVVFPCVVIWLPKEDRDALIRENRHLKETRSAILDDLSATRKELADLRKSIIPPAVDLSRLDGLGRTPDFL